MNSSRTLFYRLFIVSIAVMLTACEVRWNLPLGPKTYMELGEYEVSNNFYHLPSERQISVISSKYQETIEFRRFDSEDSRFRYDIDFSSADGVVKRRNYRRIIDKSQRLELAVTNNRLELGRKLRRRNFNGEIDWEYELNSGYAVKDIAENLIYVGDDVLVLKNSIKWKAYYSFIDMVTGKLIDKTPTVSPYTSEYFSGEGGVLYITEIGIDRSKDSYLSVYDKDDNKIVRLVVVPNDYSVGKMTIRPRPILSFLKERYVVVGVSLAGRGVAFDGFAIYDVRDGCYVFQDFVFDSVGNYIYFVSNSGDFVYLKSNEGGITGTLTHLRFSK